MSEARRPPVLGTHVREEIGRGAKLSYKPFVSSKNRLEWEVHIVFPDGHEQPVLVSGTAMQKILKSADAVVSYNRDLYPKSEGVFVPYPPRGDAEEE